MMKNEHVVIVGGSHAGAQLAASLRQEGWIGRISLVSAETVFPYHRPPLSKSYLAENQCREGLLIRPASFYEEAGVDLLLGVRVTEIHRDNKSIVLDNEETIFYDKLAWVAGASARKLDMPGEELDGVLYLRGIGDADRIRQSIKDKKSAVIIGGGYIGLETAASLRELGLKVTLLETAPRILQRVTAIQVSEFYTRIHREKGVEVVTGKNVESINGQVKVESVTCDDGSILPADVVIVGVGVVPNTSVAEEAGLEVADGLIVDEFARTSDHDIVAAGDCTRFFNAIYKRSVRIESVQNAVDQAKVAAKTLCGKFESYNALPWFWSDQYDVKLQIAGLSHGFDQVVVRGDWENGRSFAVFYFSKGKFIAVDAVNRPKEFMLSRRLLSEGVTPDAALLSNDDLPIQEILINKKLSAERKEAC